MILRVGGILCNVWLTLLVWSAKEIFLPFHCLASTHTSVDLQSTWCMSLSCSISFLRALNPSITLTVFPPNLLELMVPSVLLGSSLTVCSKLVKDLCWIFLPTSSLPVLSSGLCLCFGSLLYISLLNCCNCHNSLVTYNNPRWLSFSQWHLVIFLSYKASIQHLFIDDAIIGQPLWRPWGYKTARDLLEETGV